MATIAFFAYIYLVDIFFVLLAITLLFKMGARYLKMEEEALSRMYPTATESDILIAIPGRGWIALCVHARKRGLRRTRKAKGLQVSAGRLAARREREAEEGVMK